MPYHKEVPELKRIDFTVDRLMVKASGHILGNNLPDCVNFIINFENAASIFVEACPNGDGTYRFAWVVSGEHKYSVLMEALNNLILAHFTEQNTNPAAKTLN